MITLTLGKRGYSKKSTPIWYILKFDFEDENDKALVKLFTELGYIKKTYRSKYPQLRSNLEDVYNKEINELKADGNKHKVTIHGFSFWVQIHDLIEC